MNEAKGDRPAAHAPSLSSPNGDFLDRSSLIRLGTTSDHCPDSCVTDVVSVNGNERTNERSRVEAQAVGDVGTGGRRLLR